MLKPHRIVCLLLILTTTGCTHFAQDNWTGKDKAQHFFFSAAASAAGTAYAEHQHLSHRQSRDFGLLFSVTLGAGKEFYDSRAEGSGWSWKDFVWDVAGAATGYALYESLAH